MAIDITSILEDMNTISEALNANAIIVEAKDSILKSLDNAEISTEERDKLFSAYIQQLSIGILTQAIGLAKDVPILKLQEKKLEAEAVKAVYDKLQSIASLKKQFGYGNATEEGLGDSSGDGLIDKQINGFYKDMVHKAVKTFSEQAAMLAQNDVATPDWMVDIMKIGAEIMADGKINILVSGEPAVTTVNYDGDATEANGLDE